MGILRILTLLMIAWTITGMLTPGGVAEASRLPASGEFLVPEAQLTRGVVLSIPKSSMLQPLYLNYWDGYKVANEIPFVEGVQVLSATGFGEEELSDLNSSMSGAKRYVTLGSLSQASLLWEDETTALISVTGGITIYEDQEAVSDEEEEDESISSGSPGWRPGLRPVARPIRVPAPEGRPDSGGSTTGGQAQLDPKPTTPPLNRVPRPVARPSDLATSARASANQLSRHAEAWVRAGVPERALRNALNFARKNSSRIKNKRYILIADYTAKSGTKRLFLLDNSTGRVERYITSHGRGSDPGHTGYAKKFSNRVDSHASPPGFHLTQYRNSQLHGRSILLHGLEDQNSNSARRGILIHRAAYTTERYVKSNGNRAGRSHGCLAVESKIMDSFLERISDGVLVYLYTGL